MWSRQRAVSICRIFRNKWNREAEWKRMREGGWHAWHQEEWACPAGSRVWEMFVKYLWVGEAGQITTEQQAAGITALSWINTKDWLSASTSQDHVTKSIELKPQDPSSYYLLGRWCYRVSDWLPSVFTPVWTLLTPTTGVLYLVWNCVFFFISLLLVSGIKFQVAFGHFLLSLRLNDADVQLVSVSVPQWSVSCHI